MYGPSADMHKVCGLCTSCGFLRIPSAMCFLRGSETWLIPRTTWVVCFLRLPVKTPTFPPKKCFCGYVRLFCGIVEVSSAHGYDKVCCSVLQCVAVCLQCVAVWCSVLQCVAVCCSVLQCVAVCCSEGKPGPKRGGVDCCRQRLGSRERTKDVHVLRRVKGLFAKR